MVKINLLPDVVLERRRQARIRHIANLSVLAWLGLFLAIWLGVFAVARVQVVMRNNAVDEQQRLESIANSEESVAFREEALAVQSSLEALAQLFVDRQSAGQFLQVLADTSTANVRVRDLIYGRDGAISISGTARSYQAVGEFEQAMKNSAVRAETNRDTLGYFRDVALFGASLADAGAVNFELQAGYVPLRPVAEEEEVPEDDAAETEGSTPAQDSGAAEPAAPGENDE
ncbi:MAG: hypothetical protein WD467_01640 [Candidatus Saccharimonadales bacterium]